MPLYVVQCSSRYTWRNDASDADANFQSFEEFLAEIDAVPEGLEIFLDLKDL